MKTEDLLHFFIENGIQWIQAQRDAYRTGARTLTEVERTALSCFFDPDILDLAGINMADEISNPGFYVTLKDAKEVPLLDFTGAIGITYIDTIVLSKKYLASSSQVIPILFHELVHMVQCDLLGVRKFVELYIGGWADKRFNYYAIPLEVEAYRLSRLYDTNPKGRFSVADEIRKTLGPEILEYP